MMAKAVGISASSVQRIWRTHGLQPHRVHQFKLSNGPRLIDKLRDVVGLYVDPPAHAVVLSVDEKSRGRYVKPRPPYRKAACRLPARASQSRSKLTNARLELLYELATASDAQGPAAEEHVRSQSRPVGWHGTLEQHAGCCPHPMARGRTGAVCRRGARPKIFFPQCCPLEKGVGLALGSALQITE